MTKITSSTNLDRRQLLTRGGASLAAAMLAPNLALGAADPLAVALAVNDIERTARYSAVASVQLLRSGAQTRNRELDVSTLRQGNASLSMRRYDFTSPSDIRDTKLLVEEKSGADNNLWLLLPSVGRVRRLSSSNQADSFAGTDFSYANLMTLDQRRFSHAITGQSGGNLTLQSSVLSGDFGRKVGYSTAITTLSAQSYVPSRIDYFDASGRATKTQTMGNVATTPDGKFILRSRRMVVHGTGRETRIDLNQLNFAPNFLGGHFRSQSL